jgi:hypothetical protein
VDGLEVSLIADGRESKRLTAEASGLTWASAAVGGFADCSFRLPGLRRDIPYLSVVRVMYGPRVIYEGRVEDQVARLAKGEVTTEIRCFGLQRLLDDFGVRRLWSKRDLSWVDARTAVGGTTNGQTRNSNVSVVSGNYDPSDLTKSGVQAAGNGVALAINNAGWLEWYAPSGITLVRVNATVTVSGANTGVGKFIGFHMDYVAGWGGADYTHTVTSAFSTGFRANATAVMFGGTAAGAITPTATDVIQFSDIRLLGTSLSEDTDPGFGAGGFYGGTILRDLIALIPGLTTGVVDDGSDFAIPAIERTVRGSAASVVEEVTAYYAREWGVWEDGRFDWILRNLDEPQWIARIVDLDSLELDGTIDGIVRTAYVLYTDASTGLDAESSSSSVSQRNPFVKQGRTKDELVTTAFPMTSATAAQLALRVPADHGGWAPVRGRITIPATRMLQNAVARRRRRSACAPARTS